MLGTTKDTEVEGEVVVMTDRRSPVLLHVRNHMSQDSMGQPWLDL